MIDQELIQQLLLFLKDRQDPRPTSGVVAAVNASGAVQVRLGDSGTVMSNLPIVGSAAPGDAVKLLHFPDGTSLALGTGASGTPSATGTSYYSGLSSSFDPSLYYTRGQVDSSLLLKSDIGHSHIAPAYIQAQGGLIGGFTIGTEDLSALGLNLHGSRTDSPYLGIGYDVPTVFGPPAAGVWLGFDLGTGVNAEGTATSAQRPKLSLYGSPTDYLQWDGDHLLVKAANFTLSGAGNISASNVDLTGKITATSGSIGGVSLGSSKVYVGAGNFNNADTGFYLDATGQFSLKNKLAWDGSSLTVAGTVTATAGSIGGWTLATGDLHSGNLYLDSTGSIRGNYTVGLAGWSIKADGSAEFENVTVRGSIRTAVFEKSIISAFAGSQMIAESAAVLAADATATGTTFTVTVRPQAGAAPFAGSDIIRLWDGTSSTYAQVGAGVPGADANGNYPYTATYKSGSSSATFKAGQTVIDYCLSTGGGYIWLTADDTNGPFVSVRSTAGAPWSDTVEQARLGNLQGWGIGSTPYSSPTYGLAVGQYGAASGKAWITADPTNGVLIGKDNKKRIELTNAGVLNIYKSDGATVAIALDGAGGNASFTGAVTATSGTFTGTASSIVAGGGDVKINSSGLQIGGTNNQRIAFYDTNAMTNLSAYLQGGGGTYGGATLLAKGPTSGNPSGGLRLIAQTNDGATSTVMLSLNATPDLLSWATLGGTGFHGLNIGGYPDIPSGTPNNMLEVQGNVAFSGTLGVGAVNLGGALKWAADNTYDIGAAGANRPRDIYCRYIYPGDQSGRNISDDGAGITVNNGYLYVSGSHMYAQQNVYARAGLSVGTPDQAVAANNIALVGRVLPGGTNNHGYYVYRIPSLANGANQQILQGTFPKPYGLVMVFCNGNAQCALFIMRGSGNQVFLVSDPSGTFSTTLGTSGKTNVYYDNVSAYKIENRLGAAAEYYIHHLGYQ